MRHIRLITFDVFGTLLDWQSYVEDAFPSCYDAFRHAMGERQQPGQAVFPYRSLLYDVGMEINMRGPRPSREALSFFADGLGFAKPFADSRAVQYLANMTMIGAASNCDVRHLLDVQKSLGMVFDVSVVAEDLRAYKPHAEAWDAIFDQVTRKLGFDRKAWLHISAYADTDLVPAKERGIATCFLPRPGGTDAAEAEGLAPDYVVKDLWQLAAVIAEVNGVPLRYIVKATTRTAEIASDLVTWVRDEHGPDVLQVRSCQQFQVLQLSPTEVHCEYVFTNKAALEDYMKDVGADLQLKGRERYAEADVAFSQSEGALMAGCRQRTRADFQEPRRS